MSHALHQRLARVLTSNQVCLIHSTMLAARCDCAAPFPSYRGVLCHAWRCDRGVGPVLEYYGCRASTFKGRCSGTCNEFCLKGLKFAKHKSLTCPFGPSMNFNGSCSRKRREAAFLRFAKRNSRLFSYVQHARTWVRSPLAPRTVSPAQP